MVHTLPTQLSTARVPTGIFSDTEGLSTAAVEGCG